MAKLHTLYYFHWQTAIKLLVLLWLKSRGKNEKNTNG